jgi:hypothetical protein
MVKKSSTPKGRQAKDSNSLRAGRLRKRIREINDRGEKELAAIFDSIEKAKAAFRGQKP